MQRIFLAFSACVLFASAQAKQPPANPAPQPAPPSQVTPVAPPPGMNDPGTSAAPQGKTDLPAATTSVTSNATELPVITIRRQGNDTVEEYRKNGQIYMIRILPQEGRAKYYVDHNGDGRLERDPREGPVSPVYFKLYEWK